MLKQILKNCSGKVLCTNANFVLCQPNNGSRGEILVLHFLAPLASVN